MGESANKVREILIREVKAIGGEFRNYTSPRRRGVADALLFMPGGKLLIVEIKTTDRESVLQRRERERMIRLGFTALVVRGVEGAKDLVEKLRSDYANTC